MMNNEQGRSMVEMLGVLAIIGVLSVAGITGYTMAMRKYRANEIVNAASQMVVLAMAEHETGGSGTASTSAYNITVAGADDVKATCDTSGCSVTVTGADTDVMTVARGMLPSSNAPYSFTSSASTN